MEMEIEMSDESHERGRKMSMKEDEHGGICWKGAQKPEASDHGRTDQ